MLVCCNVLSPFWVVFFPCFVMSYPGKLSARKPKGFRNLGWFVLGSWLVLRFYPLSGWFYSPALLNLPPVGFLPRTTGALGVWRCLVWEFGMVYWFIFLLRIVFINWFFLTFVGHFILYLFHFWVTWCLVYHSSGFCDFCDGFGRFWDETICWGILSDWVTTLSHRVTRIVTKIQHGTSLETSLRALL